MTTNEYRAGLERIDERERSLASKLRSGLTDEQMERGQNRAFALIGNDGRKWLESNSRERCETLRSELSDDGIETRVIGRLQYVSAGATRKQ